MRTGKKRVAILISGRGSNMAALAAAVAEPDFPAEIVGVIADRTEAPGLERARAMGIDAHAVVPEPGTGRREFEASLDMALTRIDAEIVCLAGYMRLLSADFTEKWSGRLINIHPSLLPLFRGLDSHRRCLEAGMRVHGCTVHFVTAEMDAGPIIAQAAVPVLWNDTEETLSARVLKAEHELYPLALRLVAEGKARMEGGRAIVETFGKAQADQMLLSPDRASEAATDLEQLARFTP